jgi:hypothetical protein
MRKFIFFAFIVLAFLGKTAQAQQDWVFAGSNSQLTGIYVNKNLRELPNGNVQFYQKIILKDGTYLISLSEFNCSQSLSRTIEATTFNRQGIKVGFDDSGTDWMRTIQGSVGVDIQQIVCGSTSQPQVSWQKIPGWSDLSYMYRAERGVTFISLRPQRVTMKQNEDIFDVDMQVLFWFRGTMTDLKGNPALPKQYSFNFSNVPAYPQGVKPANFVRLKMSADEYGVSETDLAVIKLDQSKEDVLSGVQTLGVELGDIRNYLNFTLADNAIFQTAAGEIRLRASDIRYSGTILRYTTTLLGEKQLREQTQKSKGKKTTPKKRRGK